MDRDEQVGTLLAGDLGTLAQRDEVVAAAHQLGAKATLAVDLALKLAGNRQHHVLLAHTTRAEGARILAAVTGIDGDDDVALAARHRWQRGGRTRFGGSFRRLSRDGRRQGRDWQGIVRHRLVRRRTGRHGIRRPLGRLHRHTGLGGRLVLIKQIDHQTVTILLVRRQAETLRRYRRRHVEHNAQLPGRPLGHAQAADRSLRGGQLLQTGLQLRAVDVDDNALRCAQGEHTVLHRSAQVEHQTGVVRRAPQAHAADFAGRQHRLGRQQGQRGAQHGKQCPGANGPSHVH
ncbi:hypothetical protein D3C78_688460 [compost metagenome]